MDNKKAFFKGLINLLNKNVDAKRGFHKAYENTESNRLRSFFLDKKNQRAQFEKEIREELHRLGKDVSGNASFAGNIHRVWLDMIGTLTGNDDEAVLDACETGENAAIKDYQDFLELEMMPTSTRELILNQLRQIKRTKRVMNQLEESIAS